MGSRWALALLALSLLAVQGGAEEKEERACPFKDGDVVRCPEDGGIHKIDGGVKRYYTGGAFEADGKPAPTVDSKEVCSLRESCKDGKPMPDPLAKEEEAKGGAADAVADELPDSTEASSGGSTRLFVVAVVGAVAFYYVRRVKRKPKS